jgi:2-iminoacetate synthase
LEQFERLPLADLVDLSNGPARTRCGVLEGASGLADFAAGRRRRKDAEVARRSGADAAEVGRVIRPFALYLSNECINNCAYCGFSRDNAILRVTPGVEEVLQEVRALSRGFETCRWWRRASAVCLGRLPAGLRAGGGAVPGCRFEWG